MKQQKQFNLSIEREKWLHKWLRKPLTARVLGELKETDLKFIEEIKGRVRKQVKFHKSACIEKTCVIDDDICKDIDKLFNGEE